MEVHPIIEVSLSCEGAIPRVEGLMSRQADDLKSLLIDWALFEKLSFIKSFQNGKMLKNAMALNLMAFSRLIGSLVKGQILGGPRSI